MPRIWAYFFILIFHLRAAACSVATKIREFLSPIKNCHLTPILPNLSLQDKHNYTILLPNPHFFFHFSQTQRRWFSSYLTHASSSSPGFFLFFFSSSPSSLTHASSPGFFLFFFFFFFFSLTPHARFFPWFFSSSPPSPLRRRHSLATTNPAVTHHFQPNHL
jgi:hypothetical protein